MMTRDMWEEVFRGFGKENSTMNATEFYVGNRFGLFIDRRSMKDNDLHGSSRLRLVPQNPPLLSTDKTKLSSYTPPPTQHHSFFKVQRRPFSLRQDRFVHRPQPRCCCPFFPLIYFKGLKTFGFFFRQISTYVTTGNEGNKCV